MSKVGGPLPVCIYMPVSAFDDMSLIQLIVERGPDAVDELPKAIEKSEDAVAETIENNVRKLRSSVVRAALAIGRDRATKMGGLRLYTSRLQPFAAAPEGAAQGACTADYLAQHLPIGSCLVESYCSGLVSGIAALGSSAALPSATGVPSRSIPARWGAAKEVPVQVLAMLGPPDTPCSHSDMMPTPGSAKSGRPLPMNEPQAASVGTPGGVLSAVGRRNQNVSDPSTAETVRTSPRCPWMTWLEMSLDDLA